MFFLASLRLRLNITSKKNFCYVNELVKSSVILYHNQINARALIGQSAMVYCACKPMEISRVFRIII